MIKDENIPVIVKWINNYVVFFGLVAFVTTSCMMLFVTILVKDMEVALTEVHLGLAAKVTFLNVLLLSLIFSVIDSLRRKWTVERPAKRITEAAEKVMEGDFSVRIQPVNKIATEGAFNQIIDCFNRMIDELKGVETLRSDFIANVSHEMKTPLAVMRNYGTLLQSPELSDELRIEYAKGVVNHVQKMAELMTNILKLNRLENQQIFPLSEEYDLSEQICECLLEYESVWESKEIEIQTEIAEGVKIKADAELLSLVWNNLFSNAFKFTESKGRVSVSLVASEQEAIVKVKDSGCGMSSETGAHIFEKFYQGDSSRSSQGNGLGLALVKRVIDILQGEITVESTLGKGTVFTVKIKL
ncbi:MAG: HAMP domain-containing histidine kinase [Erysipelotrichaceae bacterium]|nr:HAMP domain-containing histidine kinase [Erysipelotrichaceae bacterium]